MLNKIILGRLTNGGGSRLKFFKIILFQHGTTALHTLRDLNFLRQWHTRMGYIMNTFIRQKWQKC